MTAPSVVPVIETMQKNRERFVEFCRSLSEEELSRPVPPDNKWTVKDFIIHLATFEDLTTDWVEALVAGNATAPSQMEDGSKFDIDVWNNQRVAEWHDRSLDDILAQSVPDREHFVAALEKLTDEHTSTQIDFPGDNKRDPASVPFGLFLHGLARHDPVHVADIVKALPERANDPDIQEWIDDRMVQWYQQAMSGPAKR
jgi:Mycothiol maleylpyruvate isomerase N-terminal domain